MSECNRSFYNEKAKYFIIKLISDPNTVSIMERLNTLTGIEFEDFCSALLKQLNFKEIEKTKATGDYGVDIIAMKNNKKYAFQCKRYENVVSNNAIQEVYSGKDFYKCDMCGVITNSVFTDSVYKTASKLGVILIDKYLLEMLYNEELKK